MSEFYDTYDDPAWDETWAEDTYDDEVWAEHREAVEIEQQDRLIRVGDQEGERT